MKIKKPNKKILQGMSNLQLLFSDKTNILTGLLRDEIISAFYKIPLDTVRGMKKETIETKWNEITIIKKYLRNNKVCAIDFQRASKGTVLQNQDFGIRKLDKGTNVFFRIIRIDIASSIRKRYDKLAKAMENVGNKIYATAEETEIQQPILEKIMKLKN